MTLSKNRILGSPEFQISKFFDFRHFDPDIIDFVKNLWREMAPDQNWFLGVSRTQHQTGHRAGRDQSFYPQIPFSSQPQFRKPINQGCGKNHCKYCYFWAAVCKNLVNIVVLARVRPEMLENHYKYCYFWATVSKNLVNIVVVACFRPEMLEKHCKYCYFCTQHAKNLVNIAVFEREHGRATYPSCSRPGSEFLPPDSLFLAATV